MRLREIGLIAALAVGLAMPAGAQNTQATPPKSTGAASISPGEVRHGGWRRDRLDGAC